MKASRWSTNVLRAKLEDITLEKITRSKTTLYLTFSKKLPGNRSEWMVFKFQGGEAVEVAGRMMVAPISVLWEKNGRRKKS